MVEPQALDLMATTEESRMRRPTYIDADCEHHRQAVEDPLNDGFNEMTSQVSASLVKAFDNYDKYTKDAVQQQR
jgi:hypothetical protein